MKLCILITGLGTGGAENNLLKILPKLNIDVFIISLTNNNTIGKELEKKGIKIHYLGLKKNLFNLPSIILKFRNVIKKEKPDILNSYLIHSNLFGRIFGKLFGVRRVVCSVRNKHINKPFLNLIDRLTSALVNLYLPNSNAVARFMISKGIPKNKIKVIPNGIDFSEIIEKNEKTTKKAREILNLKQNDYIIGTVGNLQEKKDHKTVIRALSKLNKNVTFCIIGKGPLKNSLMNEAERLGITNRVIIKDNISNAKKVIAAFDVFVLSSLHEGMSNALLEAMASKVPVIVSDIEENKELVRGGVEGLIFRTKNPADLKKKIALLMGKSRKRISLGKNAYKKVKEEYNLKSIIAKYREVLLVR